VDSSQIEAALEAVGELLADDGFPCRVVIIGGAALALRGDVARATRDVDIVAFADAADRRQLRRPTHPLPEPLRRAIQRVAIDFELPALWLNIGPAGQWDVGLPPGFADRVRWRQFAGLDVGIADRQDLIFFKLEAAADQPDAGSRHFHDLIALAPTRAELAAAKAWARSKNAGSDYLLILDRVETHALRTLDDDRR
jgi:hypothetical protein